MPCYSAVPFVRNSTYYDKALKDSKDPIAYSSGRFPVLLNVSSTYSSLNTCWHYVNLSSRKFHRFSLLPAMSYFHVYFNLPLFRGSCSYVFFLSWMSLPSFLWPGFHFKSGFCGVSVAVWRVAFFFCIR